MQQKIISPKFFEEKRYWFHISTTLRKKLEQLYPRDNDEGFNRAHNEFNIKRICVSPTVEQCLTAIPYRNKDILYIYRTRNKIKALPAIKIFDSPITMEGWLIRPTWFDLIGLINLEKISDKKRKKRIRPEMASSGNLLLSMSLYRWWVKLDPWKYVQTA